MLNSLQLEEVFVIKTLTLDAPSLQKVQLADCSTLSLVIVYGETVERVDKDFKYTEVKNLMNLKYLYTARVSINLIDSTFLYGLQQLKEIHLYFAYDASRLFEQKRRNGHTNLKITSVASF